MGSAANKGDPSGDPREPGASNPEPVSLQLARARRSTQRMWDSLESEYGLLTGEEVAELLGAGPRNRNYAASKRTARQLIGVRRGNTYSYPGFQFDREHGGAILEVIEPLIRLADANGWSLEDLALWMCSPTTSFPEEDRPVDHLHETELVLAAAKNAFEAEW